MPLDYQHLEFIPIALMQHGRKRAEKQADCGRDGDNMDDLDGSARKAQLMTSG